MKAELDLNLSSRLEVENTAPDGSGGWQWPRIPMLVMRIAHSLPCSGDRKALWDKVTVDAMMQEA